MDASELIEIILFGYVESAERFGSPDG